MATLEGSTIASTYDRLLALPSGGLSGTTLRAITDGDSDTAIALSVATTSIAIGATHKLGFDGTNTGTYMTESADGILDIYCDAVHMLRMTEGSPEEFIVNPGGTDCDTTIKTAGNAAMFHVNGGNNRVGIGTASPSSILEVKSAASADCRLILDQTTSGDSSFISFRENSAGLSMGYDGDSGRDVFLFKFASDNIDSTTPELAIKNGVVGIGTASPSVLLDIDGGEGDAVVRINSDGEDDAILQFREDSAGLAMGFNGGTDVFVMEYGSDTVDATAPALAIAVNSNVGIGTSTPVIKDGHNAPWLNIASDAPGILLKDTNNANHTLYFANNGGVYTTGELNDDGTSPTEYMQVSATGLGIGSAPSYKLSVADDANQALVRIASEHESYTGAMIVASSDTAAGGGWWGFRYYSDLDDAPDVEYEADGLGQVWSDTADHGGAADYAEYFETFDGNVIAVGSTVVLVDGKVRAANDGEAPFGVVRPEGASIIGNSAWARWQGKRMTDDYGAKLLTPREWDGESYQMIDKKYIDENGEEKTKMVSTGRKKYTGGQTIINSEWDKDREYIPRSERNEWQIIGLLGQVPITKGQPVASSWIKMNAVSDSVDMYFIK